MKIEREWATPRKIEREWAMARIARALGVAGYEVEECDAIMEWLATITPAAGRGARCRACDGTGRRPVAGGSVISGQEQLDGLTEQTAMLVQGICIACKGSGVVP